MRASERQLLAERVMHFIEKIANFNKKETVLHFENEGFKRSGLYKIIARYEERGTAKFEAKSGRKPNERTEETHKKLRKFC